MANFSSPPGKQFRNIGLADLRRYRLPLAGLVSILHRVSGLLLFLGLPALLFILDMSLTSQTSYFYLSGWFQHPLWMVVKLVLLWGFFHHLCAGGRHLLLDVHVGLEKNTSRKSAVTVLAVSLLLTALVFILSVL